MNSPFKKPRNDVPSYEELEEGTTYAITFNPNDKCQCFGSTDRVSAVVPTFLNALGTYRCASYELYPEVSKLGRIHLHGFIIVNDKNLFYVYFIPYILKISTISMKPIDNFFVWMDYLVKQQDFHKYVERHLYNDVPLDVYGYKVTYDSDDSDSDNDTIISQIVKSKQKKKRSA